MAVINIHDAKTHFSKYLEQVAKGKEIVIGKHGKPVARLVPMGKARVKRIPGALSGKGYKLSADFDKPMPELFDQLAER